MPRLGKTRRKSRSRSRSRSRARKGGEWKNTTYNPAGHEWAGQVKQLSHNTWADHIPVIRTYMRDENNNLVRANSGR